MGLKLKHIVKILNTLSDEELNKEFDSMDETQQITFTISENLYENFGLMTFNELISKGYSYQDIDKLKLIFRKGDVILQLKNSFNHY